jgi:hypothetical protein
MENYAENPRAYIRGFIILQNDIRQIFEYIEPSDQHLIVYSEKIGKLLTSACFEIESNLKAILRENGYQKSSNSMTMSDYCKVELSHRLSKYEVYLPEWTGQRRIVRPFEPWGVDQRLQWYQEYNGYKHDRAKNAPLANFRNLIDAWCGAFVVLSSQFFDSEFSVDAEVIGWQPHFYTDDFNHGIGGYLKVKYPNDWEDHEKYEFSVTAANWNSKDFIQSYRY